MTGVGRDGRGTRGVRGPEAEGQCAPRERGVWRGGRRGWAASALLLLALGLAPGQPFLGGFRSFLRGGSRGSRTAAAAEGFPLRETEAPPVLNVPVYSLATLGEDGETNMNILTYTSPVGIRPARLWCISLYRKTKSHENFMARKSGTLQLLMERHAPLTHLLGGQSRRDVDKAAGSKALGFEWQRDDAVEELLLPGCAAYIRLVLVGDVVDAGDHDIAVCRLEKILVPASEAQGGSMMSAFLREQGLISDKGQAVPPEP